MQNASTGASGKALGLGLEFGKPRGPSGKRTIRQPREAFSFLKVSGKL